MSEELFQFLLQGVKDITPCIIQGNSRWICWEDSTKIY